jgi:hypothetical protein
MDTIKQNTVREKLIITANLNISAIAMSNWKQTLVVILAVLSEMIN